MGNDNIKNTTLLNFLNYFGDWGLGIGDWAQSPIPNPQSPVNYYNIIL